MDLATLRDRVETSFPAALVRRFFALELLDRSFGLAAQAFVAMLPLVIVVVSLFVTDTGAVVSEAIGNRFALDSLARGALRVLFEHPGVATISWLAIVLSLLSAFSLSRRLARVYASIFGVPPLPKSRSWHGLIWIVMQVILFILASSLRAFRIDSGLIIGVLATIALLLTWFLADLAGLRLLVPAAPMNQTIASAVVAGVGRVGIGAWAAVYMPASLSQQASQYGPIGVTFAIFTYILAGVLVYVCAPLIVTTWVSWREGRTAPSIAE